MRFKNLLLSLSILFLGTGLFPKVQACELFDLVITKTNCNPDKKFAVKINFGYRDAGDFFTITGNGKNYGKFAYSKLPIIIDGLPGDCSTVYEFVITDVTNQSCQIARELGKVCCESNCELFDLKYDKSDCDSNNRFKLLFTFKYQNTSKCFRLKINDQNYGEFEYSALPLNLGPFEGDCITKRLITIVDCDKPECQARIEIPEICCPEKCKISDLKIERTACDSDKMFYAKIAFKATGVSDSFFLKANNRLMGKFKYGEAFYKIGPLLGDCVTKYNFLIADHRDLSCATDTLWGPVCCDTIQEPCKLYDLIVEKTDCTPDKLFYIVFNFKNRNSSDCFKVSGNGKFYGEFPYSSLPLKLGPFQGDCKTEYEFVIKDCKDERCGLEKFIGKVCCDTVPPEPCKLFDLNVTRLECNNDKQFYLKINFGHNNTSDCFRVSGNGKVYGEFPYTSLPLLLGPLPGDCKTEYELFIQDCKDPHCSLEKFIGKVCCDSVPPEPCKLFDLNVTRLECNNDKQFFLKINFGHNNTSDCFKVSGNGHVYGEFPYSSLPLLLGPLPGDCKTEYELVIKDCKDERCGLEKFIGKVCCDSVPPGPCKLSGLRFEKSVCDANGNFYVSFNFDHTNTSDCFRIQGNGRTYGEFKYSQLPVKIGPLPGDCKTEYEFLIVDCADPHCSLVKDLGVVCCNTADCKISNVSVARTHCEGERKFYAILKFNYVGTSECFRLRGNGHDYGEFRYANLPIKIGPLTADCNTPYEFVIEDCKKNECRAEAFLGKVCCDSTDAKIYELTMTRSDCEPDSTFNVKFGFRYREVSDSFEIFVNGRLIKTFAYTQVPVVVGPFKADCHTIYKFRIRDQKDTTIFTDRYIERPCCKPQGEPCRIFDVKATPLNCTGPDEYALKIDFKYQGTTNAFFDVFDRTKNIGFFRFDSLPLIINNFKQSGRDFDFIKICENDNPGCCSVVEFRTIDCISNDPSKFSIKRLIVNNSSGTVGLFSEQLIPADLKLELFNLESKQIPIIQLESGPHEILISTENLSTNVYFIRIKDSTDSKTYKFFHLR
ncbi:MAG: hypothetical protein IPI45_02805 [Saprospiraceae bacterium]|nr:hypothetical protein [Saprospiraceae bacterium]